MKKFILLASCLALLALPYCGLSRWGIGGCDVSAQSPVGGAYQWKYLPNDPDSAYLYRGNQQMGGWNAQKQKYRPLLNYAQGLWGPEEDVAPNPPPAHMVREKKTCECGGVTPCECGDACPCATATAKMPLRTWQTQGVKSDEVSRHRHSISGKTVMEDAGLKAISSGALSDDSAKLWLSIWSRDPAKRAAVVADLKKDPFIWKWVTDRCHLFAGEAASPDHFLAKDREGKPIYHFDGDPVVSLQAPDGTELWHDGGYTQGPASLQAMRKRDPNYQPDTVPGPKTPSLPEFSLPTGYGPFAVIAALAIGYFFILPRKEK